MGLGVRIVTSFHKLPVARYFQRLEQHEKNEFLIKCHVPIENPLKSFGLGVRIATPL